MIAKPRSLFSKRRHKVIRTMRTRYNHWLWHSKFMLKVAHLVGRLDNWLWSRMWSKGYKE